MIRGDTFLTLLRFSNMAMEKSMTILPSSLVFILLSLSIASMDQKLIGNQPVFTKTIEIDQSGFFGLPKSGFENLKFWGIL
jgi:hypothetical protein